MPDFQAESWLGLYAPKGLPPAVLAKLREAVAKSLADPAVAEALRRHRRGRPQPDRQGGDYMQKHVAAEVERWIAIMKKAGVQLPQ